ncbi:MAG: hypothetical protein Q8899_01625 [Weeping tea tree witches'-broom phytoplasma]|uniref:hypothetical protein n=1 Tax=Candidatus Phytoplasma melaleucae TaxID=2982630 RepID=UPI00293A6A37|nr:hypothetical protein [Weeping tea tree witches'-broom phytoplasma]
MYFFQNIKKSDMQLLPFIFHSAEGAPFRTDLYCTYDEYKNKIEFYYFKQTKYSSYFLDVNQYVVWTLVGGIYRVFVDHDYYHEFHLLYQQKINTFYVEFIFESLQWYMNIKQKRYFYFVSGFFLFIFFTFFMIKLFISSMKRGILIFILMLVLFLLFFCLFLQKQLCKLSVEKEKLFSFFIKKTELFLSKDILDDILKKHRIYKK